MSATPASTATSDRAFWIGLSILGGSYILLILSLVGADLLFTSPENLLHSLHSNEIRHAIKLSLLSCTTTTILALWVAVPLGYLLSRTNFRGKEAVDTILDVPIVLPPMVIGFSLLIFFSKTSPGQWIETATSQRLGYAVAYVFMPLIVAGAVASIWQTWRMRILAAAFAAGSAVSVLAFSSAGDTVAQFVQERFGTQITYAVPSVVLAQFAVATAFAARTMRVAFDQISPRSEQVALTLGCSRFQAFWLVALPEARRGMMTAATLAWARSLGEFGPILVFSGATRMKTEVLSTTVYLELSVGNLQAAIAVSLLMVVVAMIVLVLARMFGLRGAGMI